MYFIYTVNIKVYFKYTSSNLSACERKVYSMLPSIRTVPVSGHLKQKLNY